MKRNSFGWFAILVFIMQLFRVGEAAVPGPSATSNGKWSLGTINPSGVSGKAAVLNSLSPGIYALSETQLSSRSLPRFKQELEGCRSKFKLSTGAAAPLKHKSIRAVAGAHTGVGFLTTFPSRAVKYGWQPELYESGRIHAATFQVGDHWIGGGVIYGQASQHNSVETKSYTNSLLQEITNQLVQPFPGMAFVAGDFNQEYGVLPETQFWVKKGWKELGRGNAAHTGGTYLQICYS